MGKTLLGIDLGTSGCKITVINYNGSLVAEAFGEYATSHPHPGWSEQDAESWFETACSLLQEMFDSGRAKASDVSAVSLDGSTHNAVLMDDDFNALRPTIMWTDQRSAAQASRLDESHGQEIFDTCYQKPSPTWTLPQLAWLSENEPEVLPRVRRLLFTKDYVRYRLTGTWETDHIEAQGSLLYDMKARAWSKKMCELAGIDIAAMPPLVEPTDVVGKVTAQAAKTSGLVEGTPVVAGCSDSAIEDYAAGAVEPGNMILKLATAGNVNVMTESANPHPRTLTYSHVVPGMWYTVVATNTAASAERWFRDNFCECEKERAAAAGTSPYVLMHQAAEKIEPGSDGLFFHPYLLGERAPYWDPNLRGSFVGAAMRHGKGHFLRALLEGVAFSLRDCFRTIEEMGLDVNNIRLIGGGAKSDLWSGIVANIFNRPVLRPSGCDASFGAALLAGVGTGVFENELDAVRKCVTVRDEILPQPEIAGKYAKLFPVYCRIHDDLEDTYSVLAGVMNNLD